MSVDAGYDSSIDPTSTYDRVTAAWLLLLGDDLHYGYFLAPTEPLSVATSRLTDVMAERASLRPGLEILDVGCGVGNPALRLAKEFGCFVTGISTSEVGVAAAAKRAAADGSGASVRFELRDGMANGFPDGSFDRIWIMESSHLMPRKRDLIAESARVLRPGGRLILCDIILRSEIPLPELIRDLTAFKSLDLVFGKTKMESLHNYRRVAEDQGLTVCCADDISAEVFPTFEHWRKNAVAHREQIFELLGMRYWERFMNACDSLATLWQRGKLGYGIVLAEKP